MQTKLLFKTVTFLIIFSLIVNFAIYDKFYRFLSNVLNILEPNNNDLEQKEIKINYLKEWVVNGNVTQYSSYILTEEGFLKNYYYIEAFVILSHEIESKNINLLEYLKCSYKTDHKFNIKSNASSLKKISFMGVKSLPSKKLYRIRCSGIRFENLNSVRIAIIGENDFGKNKISDDYIEFQEPKILKINKPDNLRNGVAHCVHMLRNVEGLRSERLFSWIEIQKRIGISEISLYTYNVSNEIVDLINQKYSNGFVKIVKYLTKYEDVCKIQILNLEKNLQSSIYKSILNNCKDTHAYHFDMSDDLIFIHMNVLIQMIVFSIINMIINM